MAARGWQSMGGPLARYAPGFRDRLVALGYSPRSLCSQLGLMGRFSRWLEERDGGSAEVSAAAAGGFLRALEQQGRPPGVTVRSFALLLVYLEEFGVAVAPQPVVAGTPVEALLERCRRYLRDERGLAGGTIGNYEQVARLFVARFSRAGELAGTVRLCPKILIRR